MAKLIVIDDPVLKKRVDGIVVQLRECYPNGRVFELNRLHKSLSNRMGVIWRELGYASEDDFLEAYGFTVIANEKPGGGNKSGHHQTINPEAILEELATRYEDMDKPDTLDGLIYENPDLKGSIESLSNRSNEFFGRSLAKELRARGLLESDSKNARISDEDIHGHMNESIERPNEAGGSSVREGHVLSDSVESDSHPFAAVDAIRLSFGKPNTDTVNAGERAESGFLKFAVKDGTTATVHPEIQGTPLILGFSDERIVGKDAVSISTKGARIKGGKINRLEPVAGESAAAFGERNGSALENALCAVGDSESRELSERVKSLGGGRGDRAEMLSSDVDRAYSLSDVEGDLSAESFAGLKECSSHVVTPSYLIQVLRSVSGEVSGRCDQQLSKRVAWCVFSILETQAFRDVLPDDFELMQIATLDLIDELNAICPFDSADELLVRIENATIANMAEGNPSRANATRVVDALSKAYHAVVASLVDVVKCVVVNKRREELSNRMAAWKSEYKRVGDEYRATCQKAAIIRKEHDAAVERLDRMRKLDSEIAQKKEELAALENEKAKAEQLRVSLDEQMRCISSTLEKISAIEKKIESLGFFARKEKKYEQAKLASEKEQLELQRERERKLKLSIEECESKASEATFDRVRKELGILLRALEVEGPIETTISEINRLENELNEAKLDVSRRSNDLAECANRNPVKAVAIQGSGGR